MMFKRKPKLTGRVPPTRSLSQRVFDWMAPPPAEPAQSVTSRHAILPEKVRVWRDIEQRWYVVDPTTGKLSPDEDDA